MQPDGATKHKRLNLAHDSINLEINLEINYKINYVRVNYLCSSKISLICSLNTKLGIKSIVNSSVFSLPSPWWPTNDLFQPTPVAQVNHRKTQPTGKMHWSSDSISISNIILSIIIYRKFNLILVWLIAVLHWRWCQDTDGRTGCWEKSLTLFLVYIWWPGYANLETKLDTSPHLKPGITAIDLAWKQAEM
jgi:hypothetical protein